MKNKKDTIFIAAIIILVALCAQFYYTYRYLPHHQIEVYYNQDRPLNLEVINAVKDADKFVYFAVYTFTRQDIASAILGAKYRGLDVVGITDRNQYQAASGQKELINSLRNAGIPVYEQDGSGIMHIKALVTEKGYLSGSYNWTTAATDINDEVLEVGADPEIRLKYQNILEELFKKYQNVPQT
ncbi:MAG: phospholipase D-like domain-containing protein [Candidatus Doudnabacteria bacterium]|nr:phospholipase D-like domain-containing protein [Candidatus Doudnabacteria bacterium]